MSEPMSKVVTPLTGDEGAKGAAANRWLTAVANQKPGTQASQNYDVDSFYCKASDRRGHNEKISFSIPPDMQAMVMRLCSDPNFPEYQTMGDVFRDAVVHRMHYLRERVDDPARREKVVQYARDQGFFQSVEAMVSRIEQREAFFKRLRTALLASERSRSWAELESLIDEIEWQAAAAEEPHATALVELAREWKVRLSQGRRGLTESSPSTTDVSPLTGHVASVPVTPLRDTGA